MLLSYLWQKHNLSQHFVHFIGKIMQVYFLQVFSFIDENLIGFRLESAYIKWSTICSIIVIYIKQPVAE